MNDSESSKSSETLLAAQRAVDEANTGEESQRAHENFVKVLETCGVSTPSHVLFQHLDDVRSFGCTYTSTGAQYTEQGVRTPGEARVWPVVQAVPLEPKVILAVGSIGREGDRYLRIVHSEL